jgi:hypothetical protein
MSTHSRNGSTGIRGSKKVAVVFDEAAAFSTV